MYKINSYSVSTVEGERREEVVRAEHGCGQKTTTETTWEGPGWGEERVRQKERFTLWPTWWWGM